MTKFNANREDYYVQTLDSEFEDLFGKQAPEARNREEQLANMKDSFGNLISDHVIYPYGSKYGAIDQRLYEGRGFLTSFDGKVLVKATPWRKFTNIFALAGSACIIVLVLGLQKPLLLIGLPIIGLVNLLYVYKFASKDVYIGPKVGSKETFVGDLVKPLTEKQKHLLHSIGKKIVAASGQDQLENPLVVEDSERSFKYMESLSYSLKSTFKPDTSSTRSRTNFLINRLLEALKIAKSDQAEKLLSRPLFTEIKERLSESSAGLKQVDKWMKDFTAKFTSPSTSPEPETSGPFGDNRVFKDKLITPEEFAELFEQINKVQYIRQQIIDYYIVLEEIVETSKFTWDRANPRAASDLLIILDNTLEHIEKDIFIPTQKILQYYDAMSAEKEESGHRLENVLLLFHSKLLEIIELDQCATYYRDHTPSAESIF